MINLDPDTAEQDPRVLKKVGELNANNAGVYGTIVRQGTLHVGQSVNLVPSNALANFSSDPVREQTMTHRRDFLAQLGAIAGALAIDPGEMKAAASATANSSWDTSWIDRLATARFKVVFNASEISDGAAMNYASTFLDHFREVHDTTDAQMAPVIVFRRLGTQMAFNDLMWDRYAIGENTKINDPITKAPARRNIFWSAAENVPQGQAESTIEVLNGRGLISLVCNYAVANWSRATAQKMNLKADDVAADARANLVPGAILVPSGIYALIRAQNAGCAYMPGT